jgi:hypothetical protein
VLRGVVLDVLLFWVVVGVFRLLEEEGGLVRGMKVTNHCV